MKSKNPNLTWFKFEIDFQIPKEPRLLEIKNIDGVLQMTEAMLNTTSNTCSTIINVMMSEKDEAKREEWWKNFQQIHQTMEEFIIAGSKTVLNNALPSIKDETRIKSIKEALKKAEELEKWNS